MISCSFAAIHDAWYRRSAFIFAAYENLQTMYPRPEWPMDSDMILQVVLKRGDRFESI
jgi:hypothetical protein